MFNEDVLISKGVCPYAAKSLAKFANFGLSQNTWASYRTVANHLVRCESDTGTDMSLPFDLEKTLTFVAWMIEKKTLNRHQLKNT